MKSATLQLIELAEQLTASGEIGDGMVAQFHELATRARGESEQPALRSLFDRDLHYSGPNIVINCGSHGEAIEAMRKARGELGL